MGYCGWVYLRVERKLRAMQATQAVTSRLKYYPLILIICYFWATVNRIWEMFFGEAFVLAVLQVLGTSIAGLVNALIYGLTEQVRKATLVFFCPARAAAAENSANAVDNESLISSEKDSADSEEVIL